MRVTDCHGTGVQFPAAPFPFFPAPSSLRALSARSRCCARTRTPLCAIRRTHPFLSTPPCQNSPGAHGALAPARSTPGRGSLRAKGGTHVIRLTSFLQPARSLARARVLPLPRRHRGFRSRNVRALRRRTRVDTSTAHQRVSALLHARCNRAPAQSAFVRPRDARAARRCCSITGNCRPRAR
jgi:hypothetical protein